IQSVSIEHVILDLDQLVKKIGIRKVALLKSFALLVRHLTTEIATHRALHFVRTHDRRCSTIHFASFSRSRLIRTRRAAGDVPSRRAMLLRFSVSWPPPIR